MWILLLIAVNANNANDQPAWVQISMPDQATCEQAADTLQYWIKFDNFKLDAQCLESPSLPTTLPTK